MTDHEFRHAGEVELSRDNLVWTVLDWGYDFEIQFEAMVNSEIPQDWSSVFYMTTLDHSSGAVGSRLPNFMVNNREKKFDICFSVNGDDNFCVHHEYQLNQWYHFQISQFMIPNTDKGQYRIKVNCKTVHETLNSQPRSFPEAKLYLSNPWIPSLGSYGTMSNLTITKEG